MKKSKLLCSVLPISIIGGSIPALVTSCNDKETTIATMTIDESGVEKEGVKALDDVNITTAYIEYTGFKLNDGCSIDDIHLSASAPDFVGGVVTTKIVPTSNNEFNVRVLFQSLISVVYRTINFELVFTNKQNMENVQTISGLSASFIYGKLSVTADTDETKIVTGEKKKSIYVNGSFKAFKTIGTEKTQIDDFSNFSVEAFSTETTMKINPEIVPVNDKSFLIKLNLEDIQDADEIDVYLKFTNKVVPDWYQYVRFELTVSTDTSQCYEYTYAPQDNTATITKCNLDDETITIPASIESGGVVYKIVDFDESAFRNKANLKHLILSENINKIEVSQTTEYGSPFAGTNLESITVFDQNKTFTSKDKDGNECNCIMVRPTENAAPTELVFGCAKTTIPNTITTIGNYAFAGMTNLESMSIPKSVTSIGDYGFWKCTGLKSITFDNDSVITTLPNCCFAECTKLENFSIPNSVETIGIHTFYLSGLKKVFIPAKTTTFSATGRHELPFEACDKLEEIKIDTANTKYTSQDKSGKECNCIMLNDDTRSIYEGCKTTEICSDCQYILRKAFAGTGITSITIPKTLKDIDYCSFEACNSLESVTFEDGANVSIQLKAFPYCQNLKTVTIPTSQKTLGQEMFYRCESLESINLHEELTEIPAGIFFNCIKLKMDTVPASITTIGSNAFEGCLSVDKFSAPENSNLQKIGIRAFCQTGLKELDLSNALKLDTLDPSAFAQCESLETITFPQPANADDVDLTIGWCCFSSDSKLKKITFPTTLSKIGFQAFEHCDGLESVEFTDSKLLSIEENTFFSCSNLSSVIFSSNCAIEFIYEKAFYCCESLKQIALPSKLKWIKEQSFLKTGLTSIVIPASVTDIYDRAFDECASLASAKFENINNWKDASGAAVALSDTDFAANAKLLVACNGWTRS